MCLAPTATVAPARLDQPQPQPRARRVLSDQTQQRRASLLATLVAPPASAADPEAHERRARGIAHAFQPRNPWQDWLTSQIATIIVRLDRCERLERRLRDYASYRAIDFWEDDQALEVETLAARIAKNPARVVAQLRQSPAGIDWLLRRWRPLAGLEPQSWTDEQRTMAGQMLGGDDRTDPTAPGIAAAQGADLEAQRERVEQADAILRGLVEADLRDEGVAGLAQLRRYARSLHRQMRWTIDQFHVEHPDRGDDPIREPAPAPGFVETNPLSAAEVTIDPPSESDETKPFRPEPRPENAETKPSIRVERIASVADARPQPVASGDVDVAQPRIERPSAKRREGRLSPAREVARRQKATRRRAALGVGAGV